MRVASKVGNLPSKFGHARPLGSQIPCGQRHNNLSVLLYHMPQCLICDNYSSLLSCWWKWFSSRACNWFLILWFVIGQHTLGTAECEDCVLVGFADNWQWHCSLQSKPLQVCSKFMYFLLLTIPFCSVSFIGIIISLLLLCWWCWKRGCMLDKCM